MLDVLLTVGVEVVQGPQWLVDLLVGVPRWLFTALNLVMLAFLFIIIPGLAAHVDIDNELIAEMAANFAIVACIGAATHLSTVLLAQPYLVDVAVGFGAGAGVAVGVINPAINRAFVTALEDDAGDTDADAA
jgi:hypothetical protein